MESKEIKQAFEKNTKVPELKEMKVFINCEVPDPAEEKVGDEVEHNELTHSILAPELKNKEMMEMDNGEKVIVPFSVEFDDSGVRELIESDPFLRQVVDSFLSHIDEKNDNDCANEQSPLSYLNDTDMADEEKEE